MESYLIMPSKFELTVPPKILGDDWFSLNTSNFAYFVENIDGKLEIKANNYTNEYSFLLPDGKLIGATSPIEEADFVFQPNEASLQRVNIKKANVLFVYEEEGDAYFIESFEEELGECKGIYYQSLPTEDDPANDEIFYAPVESPEGKLLRYGYLYRLDRVGNRFDYTLILEFDDAPLAFQKINKRLFIATNSKFIVVEGFKQEVIFENLFWNLLDPSSIAYFDDENIFVGIRGGIVRVNLITKSFDFFKSDED